METQSYDCPPPSEFLTKSVKYIETESVPNCPVCCCSRFVFYAIGFDYESMTCSNSWRFVKCLCCNHVWLNPRPASTSLFTIYPSSYYAYSYKEQINSIAVWAKDVFDQLKIKDILNHIEGNPKSYLDIGCGDGRFLKTMHKRGISKEKIFGFELDEKVGLLLSAEGYKVLCQRAEDCNTIPRSEIDIITMFHVIEHVSDPGKIIRKVSDWLSRDGIFAVETPNLDSIDVRWFKKMFWGGYHFPRHWNLFTLQTIKKLLNDNGLDIISIRYQTGHSFWMWSMHHLLRYAYHSPLWLSRSFNPMKGLLFLSVFTAFDKLRAALGFKTSSMLILARKTNPCKD